MTITWTNGYQTEVNYTYGYYRDLSPNYQRFCLLLNGVDCPSSSETHQHCELGFGQGSVLIFMQRPMKELFGEQISILHMQHMPTKLLNIVRPNIIFMMIVLKNCSTNLIYLCLTLLAYMGSGAGLAMKTN